MSSISHINLLCSDFVGLSDFYRQVFGFAEVEAYRSPIFRLLNAGGVNIGFNAPDAYELLGIERPADPAGARFIVNVEAASDDEVSELAASAVRSGASLVKAPYLTYYQRFQAVLKDPEGNVLRINFSHPV
ncbi:VOC family protein [Variovorax sp. UC122_21]|uniref:VOC family protein n=1 Tax=Variovorax sp. UC122_21 TaxID=3374554 RepID=UPI00375810FE